jgi:heme/copper-type cytochrome/quinol oxidase subunit 4
MEDVDRELSYVKQEWDEAWAQSRHLETMRGQYLGFFFTVVLGVTAIAGPRLAKDSLRSADALLILAALALGLQVLSGFLYLAIVRLNAVLAYYLKIIFAIRDVMMPLTRAAVGLTPYA